MKRFKLLPCLVPVFLLAGAILSPNAARADDTIYDIQLGLFDEGTTVTVEDVVVTGSGFWGFFIQEPDPHETFGRQYSGIWVFTGNSHLGFIKRGDMVNVTGVYQEYPSPGDLSEIDITLGGGSFTVTSNNNPLPDPVDVLISEVNNDGILAENYESVLIRVDRDDNSLWSGPDNEFNEWNLYTDGVGMGDSLLMDHHSADPEGDFEYETPPVGSELTYAQGILHYTFNEFKLAVRNCEEDLGTACKPSLSGAYAVRSFGLGGPVDGVNVQFSVNVEQVTAENTDNYQLLSGTEVVTAARDANNHKIVHLTTGPQFDGAPEQITVSNVASEDGGLVMDPNQSASFRAGNTPIEAIQNPDFLKGGDVSPLVGEVVTIQGRVTAKDGNPYYYLQEGSGGPWQEIYVRLAQIGGLDVGDSVEVTGEVIEYFGSTQLAFRAGINHFVNLGPASEPPQSTPVAAADIIYNNPNSEPLESALVSLSMAVVDSSADSTTVFGEWFLLQETAAAVTDTAAMDLNGLDNAPVYYFPCVGDVVDITGILSFEFGDYRIYPRTDDDIDRISSNCGASVDETAPDAATRVRLAAPKPNPARGTAVLRFSLPRRGTAELGVYAVNGRLVRQILPKSVMGAGSHAFEWDGRNDSGDLMPSGLYFIRLRTVEGELSEKVIMIR